VFGATVTAEHQITIDRGVRIPMRDGVGLIADVYRPSPEGRYPVLLQRTPYDRSSNTNAMLMLNPVRAATAGFAVVVQDTRGRFESEGDFEPFLADIADGYDTVEWCAGQSWSNERVGMYGMSYVGATQWLAAIAHPPHLMAIAPQLTSSSFNDGWLRHDGVLALGFAGSWMLGNLAPDTFRRLRARDPKYGPAMRRALATLDELGTWLRTTPFEDTDVLDDIAPYFRDWLVKGADPDYLAAAKWTPSPELPTLPTLIIGGWYDAFLAGTLESYTRARSTADPSHARLVIGPWQHILPLTNVAGETDFGTRSSPQSVDLDGIQLDWFDRWLRPIPQRKTRDDAPVKVFVMGRNEWQSLADWPPPDVVGWPLFLGRAEGFFGRDEGDIDSTAGSLHPTLTPRLAGVTEFVSDPAGPVPSNGGGLCCWPGALPAGPFDQRQIELRDDVLTFTSAPLSRGVDVIGPVSLRLYFSADAPDVDICAKLVDVQPCGYARNLCDGVARARYRRSRSAPDTLAPGTIGELTVDMTATASHFGAGHRIRVEVAGSNFPKFERNPQTGQSPTAATTFARATIAIHHSIDCPSQLVLYVPASVAAEATADLLPSTGGTPEDQD
jgi:putative CocE/NonD family hydrolase